MANSRSGPAAAAAGTREGGFWCASQRTSLAGSNPARRTCARVVPPVGRDNNTHTFLAAAFGMRGSPSDCGARVVEAIGEVSVSSELMFTIAINAVVALCAESEWRGKLQVNGGSWVL